MRRIPTRTVLVAGILLILGAPCLASADDGPWSLRLAPVFVSVDGHDPRIVGTSGGDLSLSTDDGVGYHLALRRDRGERWGWGLDFFWFTGAQDAPRVTAAGAAGSPVVWAIADGGFASSGPGQVLFLERLEDTDMNAWTVDLCAIRTLRSSERGALQLLLGVRNADFDNDTRAVVGIEGQRGTRIDASSNYSRMIGPLVGLGVDRRRGKSRFELNLTQSVVFGDAELAARQSDFVGPFAGESQEFIAVREFAQPKSVTIPITEVRARWTYSLTKRVGLGLGAHLSLWTDVSIPPGVRPGGSLDTTYEETIMLSGLVAALEIGL